MHPLAMRTRTPTTKPNLLDHAGGVYVTSCVGILPPCLEYKGGNKELSAGGRLVSADRYRVMRDGPRARVASIKFILTTTAYLVFTASDYR